MKQLTEDQKKELMARTCELIFTEGQFDMEVFIGDNGRYPKCGTACCIGGNLDIAGREMRVELSLKAKPFVEDRADALWAELHPGTRGDWYADVGGIVDYDDVTPNMAVAHVITALPLGALAEDPAAVRAACRKARQMIRELRGAV